MKMNIVFIALIILFISCHDTKNDNKNPEDEIIWGSTQGLIFTPPNNLNLNSEKKDTIVKIEQETWEIDIVRLVNGKDSVVLYAGRDFERQENNQHILDLEWIKLERKKDSNDLYIQVKENNSTTRECDIHFKIIVGHDYYPIFQKDSKNK